MHLSEIEVIHSLPGRIRIQINGLKGKKTLGRMLEYTMSRKGYIRSFKANSLAGKALIIFDHQQVQQGQVLAELATIIGYFNQKLREKKRVKVKPLGVNSSEEQRALVRVFDPEDLPIKTQVTQVVTTGVILAWVLLKRIFWGKSAIAHSSKVHNLAAFATIVTGYPILRSGLENLIKRKKLNNDFLISTATLVSLFLKESVTGLVVIWLVNLSTLFQTLTLDKSRKAIKDMLQGKEETAWLEVDGTLISVPIESLEVNNVVAIHEGEKSPVDGVVVVGEASVSQAIISGESMPIIKKTGDTVFAGSIVEQGVIRVKAERVGDDTSVARIIHLVEEASEVRAPIENMADKYSEKIVPFSFLISALVYLLTRDFRRSMTMLIVACPCAAGLSTPTAISAAMGNAARSGMLIKGGCHLEKIGDTDVVLFDKTGTLTEGKPTVQEVISMQRNFSVKRVLQLAASLEAQTNHPLARAVINYAEKLEMPLLEVAEKEVCIGYGVKGWVDNELVLVGSEEFMVTHEVNISFSKPKHNRLSLLGQSVMYVARGQQLVGLIGIADRLRSTSAEAVRRLRYQGIENVGLITGDAAENAAIVGRRLGLDQVWAKAIPEDKVKIVEEFRGQGKIVAMIGEGINDSPALAKADVGIAMGTGGTDAAIESADIVLAGDDPLKVPALIDLSKTTMNVINQNFAFAVGINALGLMLGATKLITPLTAAILHNLSTFGVVVNSSRLLGYKEARKKGRKHLERYRAIRRKDETSHELTQGKYGT